MKKKFRAIDSPFLKFSFDINKDEIYHFYIFKTAQELQSARVSGTTMIVDIRVKREMEVC
jgi:hypothetical protein